MTEELKSVQTATTTPTLSFGTETEIPEMNEVALTDMTVDTALSTKEMQEQANLTPEEVKIIDSFIEQIDINNTTAVMNYGVGTQKKLADFSEKALSNVKSKDLGEVGNMITSH